MKRYIGCILVILIVLAASGVNAQEIFGSVRNGSLDISQQYRADEAAVLSWQKYEWTVPADLTLPMHWGPNVGTGKGIVEYVKTGGWKGTAYVRMDGSAHISSYFGAPVAGKPYVASIRARGKGTIWFGAYEYGEEGQIGGAIFVNREINNDKWVEYRALYPNNKPELRSINLFIAGKGPVELDSIDLRTAEPADAQITAEMSTMYGTGSLVEDPDIAAIRTDQTFRDRLAAYDSAISTLKATKASVDKNLYNSILQKSTVIDGYLKGKDKSAVLSSWFNEMLVLTRVASRLGGKDPGTPLAVTVQGIQSGIGYKPGERSARTEGVTITDVRSNKVRYDENEQATTVITTFNATGAPVDGLLIGRMVFNLNDSREIVRTPYTLAPGENKWPFSYSVGPETYGRAIEMTYLDTSGKVLDRWQEYYAVAAEWLRVQIHTGAAAQKNYKSDSWVTYANHTHFFAGEATDYGVRQGDFEDYLCPQVGWQLSIPARKAQIEWLKQFGVMCTIYQNISYSGQMGYEVIREHPEYALYDPNGQLAVDPVYGGVPNPIEIASPIEVGPNRKVTKPYLDRKITPWGHGATNTTRLDVVEYEANAIRDYSKIMGFNGVFTDGNWGVVNGYGYDGKKTLPKSDMKTAMELNARNQRVFSEILRQDNPNFASWYNWAYNALDWGLVTGSPNAVGTGGPKDVGDLTMKAAATRNSSFLMEIQDTFHKNDSPWAAPDYHLNMLCDNRDGMMQKFGANVCVGYLFPIPETDDPGPNAWAWPMMNYFGAQITATQHHMAGGFLPSMRPWMQFNNRYSRYIWSPDVKLVQSPEKLMSVSGAEGTWWKRLVYKLKTDYGYDLVIHFVRIPPTKKWDTDWLDEPDPVKNLVVKVQTGEGIVQDAWALRPYYFDEPQQTVEKKIGAVQKGNTVTLSVPSFKYHTMVVLRVRQK